MCIKESEMTKNKKASTLLRAPRVGRTPDILRKGGPMKDKTKAIPRDDKHKGEVCKDWVGEVPTDHVMDQAEIDDYIDRLNSDYDGDL